MVIHYARGRQYFCQSWQKTSKCAGRISIAAELAERHVTGLYLDKFGDAPMMASVVTIVGADDREHIEGEIADTMRSMHQNAITEMFAKLQALQADLRAAGE